MLQIVDKETRSNIMKFPECVFITFLTQQTFTCSAITIKTLEKEIKSFQS